jgi:hypothetical protein
VSHDMYQPSLANVRAHLFFCDKFSRYAHIARTFGRIWRMLSAVLIALCCLNVLHSMLRNEINSLLEMVYGDGVDCHYCDMCRPATGQRHKLLVPVCPQVTQTYEYSLEPRLVPCTFCTIALRFYKFQRAVTPPPSIRSKKRLDTWNYMKLEMTLRNAKLQKHIMLTERRCRDGTEGIRQQMRVIQLSETSDCATALPRYFITP